MSNDLVPRLIIVCGLTGAGKTTHAKKLAGEYRSVRLCPDDWMNALSIDLFDEDKRAKVEALQWKVGQELLALGLTVIIEWGTWSRSERDALRLRAKSLGTEVELYYIKASIDVLHDRIKQRGMDPPVTRDVLMKCSDQFQAPDSEEMALYDNAVLVET